MRRTTGEEIVSVAEPFVRATPGCDEAPRGRGVIWLEPRLYAEVAFAELTNGRLRDPVFRSLSAGVQQVVSEITAAGGTAYGIIADLTKDEDSRRIVWDTVGRFKGLGTEGRAA